MKVLIADSKADVRLGPDKQMLRDEGWQVDVVLDEDQAHSRMRDDRYDLIILDAPTPKPGHSHETGKRVLAALRKNSGWKTKADVPVIILSGCPWTLSLPGKDRT